MMAWLGPREAAEGLQTQSLCLSAERPTAARSEWEATTAGSKVGCYRCVYQSLPLSALQQTMLGDGAACLLQMHGGAACPHSS